MKHAQTNPKNDRLKREYLGWLKNGRQRSQATVEQVRRAIDRFEKYNAYKDFSTFNKEQAVAFKRALVGTKAKASGSPISYSTAHHTLQVIKDFMFWLHGQTGYRRKIRPNDIAYLSLSMNEVRAAKAPRLREYPSFEQIRATLKTMPTATEVQKRDRAVVALLALTGIRDRALVSLKLKHIMPEQRLLFQDAREVKTKFAKTIETWFFPVGEDIEAVVVEWVRFLREEKLFSPDDPLFPKTALKQDKNHDFKPMGISREHWANATPVRQLVKAAFIGAGLPYFHPHSFRNTLTQLAYQLQLLPEQLKAWSENLGHESVMTTLGSYGHLARERKQEIMDGLRNPKPSAAINDDMLERLAEKIVQKQNGKTTA